MIVTPRRFSAEVLRRGLRTLITSNVIWIKILSAAVRRHMSVNHFLAVVLLFHVVSCHSLNVCGTHNWELRCKQGWTDMSVTSRIDHQLVLLSLAIGLIFPVQRISRVPHRRIQSCLLETNLMAVQACLVPRSLRLLYCCRFH